MNSKRKACKTVWLFLMVALLLTYSLGIADEKSKHSKERVIVDLSKQMNGCADCHKGTIKTPDGKEKDITLAGGVNNVSKHPKVESKATIKDCMKCHGVGERRIRFVNEVHDVHLNSPIYVGEFKQTCGGCHDMRYIKGL